MNLPQYKRAVRDAHALFEQKVRLANLELASQLEWLDSQFFGEPDPEMTEAEAEDAVPAEFLAEAEAAWPDSPAQAGEYAPAYEAYRRIRDSEKELFILDGADVLNVVRKLLPDAIVTEPGVSRGIEDLLEHPEAGVRRSRPGRHRKPCFLPEGDSPYPDGEVPAT